MVKLFAFVARKEGLTREEFVEHWRTRHGPLIAGTPSLERLIVRYEQHVRHRPDAISGNPEVDGVAVQWFETIDDFVAFTADASYAELIAPDEQAFLNMDEVRFVVTEEPHVVIEGADRG